jgi:hypothetical protein
MQHYGLYYAFVTVVSSLVGGSQIPINPTDFMTKFHQHYPFFNGEQHINAAMVFCIAFIYILVVMLLLTYYAIRLHVHLTELQTTLKNSALN